MSVTQEIHSAAHECVLFLVMLRHLYTHLPKLRKSSTEWDIQMDMTIYRCPYVSQQSRLPLQSKESQVMQSVKPRDCFSSQLKHLAGLPFSCLHVSFWCISKTLGYVRNPHRTTRHKTYAPLEQMKGQAGCLCWQKKPQGTLKWVLVFLIFPVSQIIMTVEPELCYSLNILPLPFLFFLYYSHHTYSKSKLWICYHWKCFS